MEEKNIISQHVLEAVQPKGIYPPIFFLCPVKYTLSLAKTFDTNQPIYRLNPRALFKFHKEISSLSVIAEQYTQEMKTIQPDGPYHIVGFCGQANLTLETAKQLQTQGCKIAFLGLIHAIPYYPKWTFLNHLIKLRRAGLFYLKQKTQKIFRYKSLNKKDHDKDINDHNKNTKQKSQLELEYDHFITSFNNALNNYTPTIYNGDITLFYQSEESSIFSMEIELARSVANGKIEVCEIPAKYDENLFISPQVEILGEKLKKSLEKIRG